MTPQIKQRIEQIRRGEVPEGYKRTKVGIVPSEWEITKLYLISSHVTKKNTNGEIQTTFTNSATQGVIKQTDYFDKEISNKENITSYYVVQENDYIYNPRISVSAPCGPINKSHFPENGVVSPLYTVFRLNDVFQKNKYIEFFFKSSSWHSYMCGIANYGARHDRMNITTDDLFSMPISFPPLSEQEKIAEILQTQDKVIELQQKKIDELKKLKKVYLSKMFPKKGCNVPEIRFPGFTDPWEQRKLGEVAQSFEYGLNAAAKEYDGINKYLRITDIDDASRKFNTDNLTSPDTGLETAENYRLVDGDILFARTGASVGKSYIYRAVDGLVYFAGFLIRARIKPEYDAEFIFQNTLSESYGKYIQVASQRSGQPGVNAQEYADYKLYLPTYDEQHKIGAFLRSLDNLITLHQRKCDEEKQKKKALMQLLLTGIVRVEVKQ